MSVFSSAEIDITAKDKTKKGIDSAKKGLGGLTNAVKSYGIQIAAASAAVAIAVKIGQELIDTYKIQEQAEAKLEGAIKATGKQALINADNLKAYAAQLQKVTLYGDETTISAMAILQNLANLNEKGIKQLIPGIQDMATAMGLDLQTAASLVGKTLGSTTNALSRYGVVLDMSGTKTEKIAELTKVMHDKFGGMAEYVANTATGTIEHMSMAYSDLKEQMGRATAEGFKPVASWLQTVFERMTKNIKAANDYRDALNKIKGGTATTGEKLSVAQQQLAGLQQQRAATVNMPTAWGGGGALTKGLDTQIALLALRIQSLQLQAKAETIQKEAQNKQNKKIADDMKRRADTAKAYTEQWQALLKIQEGFKTPLEKERDTLVAKLNSINMAWAKGSEYEETRLRIQKKINDRLKEIAIQMNTISVTGARGGREYAPGANGAIQPTYQTSTEAAQSSALANNIGGLESRGTAGNEPAMGAISKMLIGMQPFFGAISGAASGLMGMIGSLSSVQAILDPISTILGGIMNVLAPVINEILQPLQGALIVFGELIGHILAPILKAFSPIIQALAKAFVWLYNNVFVHVGNAILWVADKLVKELDALTRPFRFMADLLVWVGKHIYTFGQNVAIAIHNIMHPFQQQAFVSGPGGFSSNAFSAPLQGLNYTPLGTIDIGALTTAGATAQGATAGGGANYTAGRTVNVGNIIINTDVISGEGGLRQLAIMIRDEILSAEALGV